MQLKLSIIFLFISLSGYSQSLVFEAISSDINSNFGYEVRSSTSGNLFCVSQIGSTTSNIYFYNKSGTSDYFQLGVLDLSFTSFAANHSTFAYDLSADGSTMVCCYETVDEELLCGKYLVSANSIDFVSSEIIEEYQNTSFSNNSVSVEIENSCNSIIVAFDSGNSETKYFQYDISNQYWIGQEIYSNGSILSEGNYLDVAKHNDSFVICTQSQSLGIGADEILGLNLDENCQPSNSFEVFESELIRDIGISSDGTHMVNLTSQTGVDGEFLDEMLLNVFTIESDQIINTYTDAIRLIYQINNLIHNYVKISDNGQVMVSGASYGDGDIDNTDFGHSRIFIYEQLTLGLSFQKIDSINVDSRLSTLDLTPDGKTLFVGESSYDGRGRVRVYDLATIVSVDDHYDSNDIIIYPNPVNQLLTIQLNDQIKSSYYITNVLGQVVLRGGIDDILTEVEVNELKNGMYYLSIAKEISHAKPFIIHR